MKNIRGHLGGIRKNLGCRTIDNVPPFMSLGILGVIVKVLAV